ncbi:DUF4003 family protein [Romboutsia weinsteinii]|uniref:DUF4003 family protein n=1 Tax=Romboutsia weinsteinii TaxID=2020949 RepID=A0A371J5Q7_9FIRM|nr:DUF4003 family protein [Romboutsia weinsteinii]RDY28006.1 DUF4003 family protein [Romboutsia weinsteinii]
MKNYLLENKVNLLIKNNEQLKMTKKSWNIIGQGCALAFTIDDKAINHKLVDECIDIIKDSTIIISKFRGISMIYVATLLSFEDDKVGAFKVILEIFKTLKSQGFWGNDYLIIASLVIYKNRNKINIYTSVENIKYIYDYMNQKHPYLTSSDDYCNAAIISIYSTDLKRDLEYMEECYKFLNKNGLYKGNCLQAISQLLCLSNNRNMASCKNLISLIETLNKKSCKISYKNYSIFASIAMTEFEEVKIVNKIEHMSNEIKEYSDLNIWGREKRNSISSYLVISQHLDEKKDEYEKLINISQFLCIASGVEEAIQASNTC